MKLPPVQSEMMLFETGFGKIFAFHQETKKKKILFYHYHLVFYNLTLKDV